MYEDCLSKRGAQVVMGMAHVHATDVITIKAPEAVIIIVKQFLQHLDVNTLYVQLEYFHAVVKSVQRVLDVLVMLTDLI
jgi:hypothetical protein